MTEYIHTRDYEALYTSTDTLLEVLASSGDEFIDPDDLDDVKDAIQSTRHVLVIFQETFDVMDLERTINPASDAMDLTEVQEIADDPDFVKWLEKVPHEDADDASYPVEVEKFEIIDLLKGLVQNEANSNR